MEGREGIGRIGEGKQALSDHNKDQNYEEETSWLLDEKRQQSVKESVKPSVEAKKVSNKFPGLSVAPTATKVA